MLVVAALRDYGKRIGDTEQLSTTGGIQHEVLHLPLFFFILCFFFFFPTALVFEVSANGGSRFPIPSVEFVLLSLGLELFDITLVVISTGDTP